MKKLSTFTLLMLSLMLLSTTSCKDDDDTPTNPIDKLPPATQTGANTFGCLLDGEAFLPGREQLTNDAVYQFVNGGYYFTLQANRRTKDFNLIRLGCNTENLEILEGEVYALNDKQNGSAYGKYFSGTFFNYTSNLHGGEMIITKLDLDKNIVSGTFWYDIEDQNGIVHEIREGRFDMKFSQ